VTEESIDVLLQEGRTFPPPPEFAAQAVVNDPSVYDEAAADLDAFWLARTREFVGWFQPPTVGLDWDPPHCTWFADGTLNASHSCLDRHVEAGRGDRVAYHFVPEDPSEEPRDITYHELRDDVCRLANALRELGVGKGDTVGIYMGMVPETAVAMLACARIGAPHVVVFGGFSPSSLGERLEGTSAKLVITQDEAWRKGAAIPLKAIADDAVALARTVERMVVLRRTGADVPMTDGRDVWWHDAVDGRSAVCEPEQVEAEHMLFALHTSGTTAKPKAAVHTTGGYLTYATVTHRWIFDIKDGDTYWCAADIGWVTGHSYIVYGPLANHTTGIIYEGAPDWPDKARLWAIAERYRATILYTAPTAIRAFMRWGTKFPESHDLSSLRLLGSVGEPINPEAWVWYWKYIGGERCPVVDTWWQTETGAILISPLPGVTTLKPGSATQPFPGIEADVLDDAGNSVPLGGGGYLVLKHPWPAIARTIWGDPDRYVSTYFSKYGPETYVAGDGVKRDDEGYYWLLGRIDDVMNVAGHRLSTYEIESALVDDPKVAEAAVVSRPDDLVGEAIVAFVTLKSEYVGDDAMAEELRDHVAQMIGKIARPHGIIFTTDLPKTRSGKIMRRLLRDVATGRPLGDVTTLANAEIVEQINDMVVSGAGDE